MPRDFCKDNPYAYPANPPSAEELRRRDLTGRAVAARSSATRFASYTTVDHADDDELIAAAEYAEESAQLYEELGKHGEMVDEARHFAGVCRKELERRWRS